MIKEIYFITGNSKKAEEVSYHLKYPLTQKAVDLVEIQSLDLSTIIEDKARRAYEIVKSPVLVEDTSLRFTAMNKLPGPLVKWFLGQLGNEGLCRLLDPYKDRSAVAEVMFGLFDGKVLKTFSGSWHGSIAFSPRGEGGFGWDPIFIPQGYSQTWAEMGIDKQKETSMRGIALRKLEKHLEKNR